MRSAASLPQLTIDRFLYSREGDHLAVLDVIGRVSPGLAPTDAELRITREPLPGLSFPARECTIAPGTEAEPFWHAAFTVPYAVVEQPRFGFELVVPGAATVALGRPTPLALDPVTDAARSRLAALEGTRLTASRLRTRALALATAVAVTAGSTPAAALADGFATGTHAHAVQQRIEHLARFAAQRARAEAAHKQARAAARAASRKASSKHHPARVVTGASTKLKSHCVSSTATLRSQGRAQATNIPATDCPVPATPKRAHRRHPGKTARHAEKGATSPTGTIGSTGGAADPTAPGSSAATSSSGPATGAPSAGPAATTPNTTAPSTTTPNTTAPGATTPSGTTTPPTTSSTSAAGATPPTATGGVPAGTSTTAESTPSAPPAAAPSVAPRPTSSAAEHRSSSPASVRALARFHATGSGGSALHAPPRRRAQIHRAVSTGGTGLLSPTPPGYLGPKSWTGTVSNDPALVQALGDLSNLLRNGDTPPRFLIPVYMAAGHRFHVPWQVLAGINAVESDYGRNLNTSTAGAIGWMQFEPSTWKQYGMAVDGHSVANPYDPEDAIFSAARYLAAAGAAQDISRAIFAYNHATWYVDMVLTRARAIAERIHPHTHTGRRGLISVYFAYARHRWRERYHSGLLSHYDRLVAAANMVSAANFPYLYGGGHEQPARFGPFDCSGSVSYVMQQAGYRVPTTVSGQIPSWKFPAGPGRVTIFYNPTHTFMRIGNRYFGTSGFARPGGGAGWFSTNKLPVGYLANFREVHVPSLGTNSFAAGKPGRGSRKAHHKHRSHHTRPGLGVTITPFVSASGYLLQVPTPFA